MTALTAEPLSSTKRVSPPVTVTAVAVVVNAETSAAPDSRATPVERTFAPVSEVVPVADPLRTISVPPDCTSVPLTLPENVDHLSISTTVSVLNYPSLSLLINSSNHRQNSLAALPS